jgi:hypothetical protein
MHPIMAVAFGGLAVMAASTANGQERSSPMPGLTGDSTAAVSTAAATGGANAFPA